MSRQYYLSLAARKLRMPIGADLVLHQHADHGQIILNGERLVKTIAQAAETYATPLAFPIMDLKMEKAALLPFFGVAPARIDQFHFTTAPDARAIDHFEKELRARPPARLAALAGALRHIARETRLTPVGMSIGPFSLASKLLADPITPVYLAGASETAATEPEVATLEAALRISAIMTRHSIALQLAADATAVFIAEPAANKVFFSPRQMAAGSDNFERLAMAPNRAIAAQLAAASADLLFHCCGDITDPMLDAFCSLRPALLSLGGSRALWEDAARVPKDIVLYGNLPSKQFYSDETMPVAKVEALAAALAARMETTGHPFILGTECDTLHVEGCADTIRAKIARAFTLLK